MHSFRNSIAHNYGAAQDLEQKQRKLLADFLRGKIGLVIELACGNGKVIQDILQCNTDLVITGIDYNETMIQAAKKYLPEVNFIQGDILHIEEYINSQKFDFVICLNSLHNLPNIPFIYQTLQTMSTITAEKGYICFDVRNKRNPFIWWSYKKNRQNGLCFFSINPYNALSVFKKEFTLVTHQGVAYKTLEEANKQQQKRFFKQIYRLYIFITNTMRFFAPYHFIILQKK